MTDDELARHEEVVAAVETLREENLRLRKSLATALRKGKHADRKPAGKGERQLMVMRFGKHKGLSVSEVPAQYAEWLLGSIKEKVLKDGHFSYDDDILGAELMKVVFAGDLDAEVDQLIQSHKAKYRTFDAEGFRQWLGKNKGRKLRCLWLGVAFYNKMRHKEHAIERLAETD